MIQQLVYVSRATKLFKESSLIELLDQARSRNLELSITGLLLYKDQSFIQLIEGPEESIRILFEKINNDTRHTRVKTIIDEQADQRTFNQWSMGFYNLDNNHNLPKGFVDFFSNESTIDDLVDKPSRALDLLHFFRLRS